MWSAIGQFGLFLAAALIGAGLAWQWRARRAWRREQALKREWNETLENVESITSRRLGQAREAAASELAAREAEIERLRAELEAARAEARRSSRASVPLRANGPARADGPVPGSGPARGSGPVRSDGPLPKAPSSTTTPRRPSRPRARSATAGNGRGADDLRQIRGVGRVYASKLRELGYTTFLDIASWGPEEVERVSRGLDTSRARIERGAWISQARALHERLHGTEAPPE